MTRPAGRHLVGYLAALARAAGWTGPDPGLPARPRPRSRFEPEHDDAPPWLLGDADEEPPGRPGDLPAVDGRRDGHAGAARPGTGTQRAPVPAPPAAVVGTASAAARPLDGPPMRVETPDAGDRPPVDPSLPGRPAGDAILPAPARPPRAPDPGADALGTRGEPPATVPARPVPGPGDADLDDRRRPGESDDERRRSERDPRRDHPGDDRGDETPMRPRATARPVASVVVDDPFVRPAGRGEDTAPPPPVVIEIGRIEVRIAPDGPPVPSAAAPSRSAPAAPGPTLADYLAGLAGTAGRRP